QRPGTMTLQDGGDLREIAGAAIRNRFVNFFRGHLWGEVTKRRRHCQLAVRSDALQIEAAMRPSFATHVNLDLLEENYRRWQDNPESVDSGWSAFFEGFELGDLNLRNGAAEAVAHPPGEVSEGPLQ